MRDQSDAWSSATNGLRASHSNRTGKLHFVGKFLGRCFAAERLEKFLLRPHQFAQDFNHMHRDADGAGLVRKGPRYPLSDPPARIGRKLVAPAIVEFFHPSHQSDIAFLDEVQERQAAVNVFLADGDNQAQVGLRHFGPSLIGLGRALL